MIELVCEGLNKRKGQICLRKNEKQNEYGRRLDDALVLIGSHCVINFTARNLSSTRPHQRDLGRDLMGDRTVYALGKQLILDIKSEVLVLCRAVINRPYLD